YPQPSFIFFKINIFIGGMCLAFAYFYRDKIQSLPWLILAMISLAKTAIQIKLCAFFIIFMLFFDNERKDLLHRFMGGRIAKFLGDTSYSVYLLHSLILFPVLYILL